MTCITQESDYNKVGLPLYKWHARIGEESLLAGEFAEWHFAEEIARSRIKQAFACFPNRESQCGASRDLLLFVILSERSESKDPYTCKKSQRSRVAQQQLRDCW